MTTISLKHLDYDKCPVCFGVISGVSVGHAHTNGDHAESVRFRCGAEIGWSPNFGRENIVHSCPHAHGIAVTLRGHIRRIESCKATSQS